MPVFCSRSVLFGLIAVTMALSGGSSASLAQDDIIQVEVDSAGGVPVSLVEAEDVLGVPDVPAGSVVEVDAQPPAAALPSPATSSAVSDAAQAPVSVTDAPLTPEMWGDDFFDANDLVPNGEMARSGPVKVSPTTQPGSKLVVVQKNASGNTKSAQIVAAERALDLGRYESALQLFDGLYEKNKKDGRVLMGRAVALQKLERFDEAMQMYEELSVVEPKNIDIKVNMLGLLGTRYPAVALRRLLDLYEGNTGNVGLTAQIAIAYAQSGDTQSALKYLGVAASMEPNNANHIMNMAIISDRAGMKAESISYYENALEIDTVYGAGHSIPRDVIYERLAQIR